MKADDFNKVLDEYTDWLDEPAQAKKKLKLKDVADALDAFMIASNDYNTEELEERLLNRGVYTEEELKDLKENKDYQKFFK